MANFSRNKTLFLLLALTAATASCGSLEFYGFIDEELRPYLAAFEAEAVEQGVSLPKIRLSMTITDLPLGKIGECITATYKGPPYGGKVRTVRISRSFWDQAFQDQRTVVVYHELGHCWLDRDHVTDRPSIMNPYVIRDFKQEEGYYLGELFGNAVFFSSF